MQGDKIEELQMQHTSSQQQNHIQMGQTPVVNNSHSIAVKQQQGARKYNMHIPLESELIQ